MSQLNQKFIITQDVEIANQLNAKGFRLISQDNGMYKFINQPPKNFTFDGFNMEKICFTNILSF